MNGTTYKQQSYSKSTFSVEIVVDRVFLKYFQRFRQWEKVLLGTILFHDLWD